MCSLQFAKASAATLLQQENIDSAFICTAGQIKCILLHLYSGDAGGAAGGKARSTEAQTNNRE
jgi:hypothetical protein